MPSKLQYCVYVLLSMHDNGLYIGFTTDLQRRLTEHFNGESKSTAPRRPFCLIFCEYFFSKEDAERREGYLKTTAGRKGLKLVLRNTLKSRVWDCPMVTQHSSPAGKIALFRSLFRGREDVYPRRFESRKTGKSGYSPACANEWVRASGPPQRCPAAGTRLFRVAVPGRGRWQAARPRSGCHPARAGTAEQWNVISKDTYFKTSNSVVLNSFSSSVL